MKLTLETNISMGSGPEFITICGLVQGDPLEFVKGKGFEHYIHEVIMYMYDAYKETDGEGGDFAYLTITGYSDDEEQLGEVIYRIDFNGKTKDYSLTKEEDYE